MKYILDNHKYHLSQHMNNQKLVIEGDHLFELEENRWKL